MKDKLLFIISFVLLFTAFCPAGNTDPYNDGSKYAYGENVGWFNFAPSEGPGVTVGNGRVTGYIWQENIGWINLSPANPGYGGVTYNSNWELSGYAWGENVGWINFNPTYGGVSIDHNGNFSGYAWGENIGWLNFDNADLFSSGVKACVVGFDDLRNFAEQWLMYGPRLDADLNFSNDYVNFVDYSILASYWLDFCPDNWPLK